MPAVRRRPGITSVATLAGFVLTVGVAHLTAPEWSRAAGLDVWNADTARADLAASRSESDRIDVRNRRIVDQIGASDGVAARVAAGGQTLAAAVAELTELNADRPGWADGLRFAHPDAPTPRQQVARYVIAKLRIAHAADPSGWAPLSARLEAEYAALGE